MSHHSKRSQLVAALREIVDTARADYRTRENAAGIAIGSLRALQVIGLTPGIRSSGLAAALHLDRSTVSNLLRELQAGQLIRRVMLQSDRRGVALEITDMGRAVLARSGAAGGGLLARIVAGLTVTQAERLSAALRPLSAQLKRRPRS